MGRMMIESLANGRDGCMHGCFGFTRIKEEKHARTFSGPAGVPSSNTAMIGDSYQDDFGTGGGNPYGNVHHWSIHTRTRVPVERWFYEQETHAVSIIFLP